MLCLYWDLEKLGSQEAVQKTRGFQQHGGNAPHLPRWGTREEESDTGYRTKVSQERVDSMQGQPGNTGEMQHCLGVPQYPEGNDKYLHLSLPHFSISNQCYVFPKPTEHTLKNQKTRRQ